MPYGGAPLTEFQQFIRLRKHGECTADLFFAIMVDAILKTTKTGYFKHHLTTVTSMSFFA